MRNIIDLFAGAGGLSLGAARAGFNIVASVELDEFAVETHKKNFPKTTHLQEDVAKMSGSDLMQKAKLLPGQLDGIIGGPPCQGFSTIGKRDIEDSRNTLFSHFFRLVAETRPKFFVAENVPGILDRRYDEIRAEAMAQLPADYVCLPPLTIKADQYGVATTRTRIFFIGYDPKYFALAPTSTDFLPNHVSPITVKHALKGLPTCIEPTWLTEEQGWRKVSVLDHEDPFYRRVVGEVPPGVGQPSALKRLREKREVSGCMGTKHGDSVIERFKMLKQGQADVVSRGIRLDPAGLCPTLRAGTSKEKGSYQAVRPIHPTQPRVITAREAARLQGFPDWFVFHATKWHSFRQIGNSVSPMVAEAILRPIFIRLKETGLPMTSAQEKHKPLSRGAARSHIMTRE